MANKVIDRKEMTDKERADRLELMVDRMSETIATLRGELLAANNLLRSANSVVTRQGRETNWDTLGRQIELALESQHLILYQ
jgi:hypothetical protein